MKNIEKYLNDIIQEEKINWQCKAAEIMNHGKMPCETGTNTLIVCSECKRRTGEWLSKECKTAPTLTSLEKDILCVALDQGYRWLAKDVTSGLMLHTLQPEKVYEEWRSRGRRESLNLFCNMFHFVSTIQTESREIKELLEYSAVE